MTVDELLSRMSSEELTEWMAYDRLEPIGFYRLDMVGGILASMLANQNRKRGSQAYKPQDFMPFLDKPEVDHTDGDSLRAMFGTLAKDA
jgi:hypothetical protein